MNVWIRTPFSIEKNLGKAYNEEMAMIPEGDVACFIDGDVNFLTPDFGKILYDYANLYYDAVLTCYTNRIHELAGGQLLKVSNDIGECITKAESIKSQLYKATVIHGTVSGFLLVIPKNIWHEYKFTEENKYKPGQLNLLGVDNEFTNKVRAAGIPVLRMDGMLVYHSYRLLSNGKDKSHLL